MTVSFKIENAEFERDADKHAANLRKHAVEFEEAAEVFFDPFYQIGNASVDEEKSEYIISYTFGQKILLVVFVERQTKTRIISARQATATERKLYEER